VANTSKQTIALSRGLGYNYYIEAYTMSFTSTFTPITHQYECHLTAIFIFINQQFYVNAQ